MSMCPDCGSDNITLEPYDHGVCRETGYHDAGERYACRDCGVRGDADDLGPFIDRYYRSKTPARYGIAPFRYRQIEFEAVGRSALFSCLRPHQNLVSRRAGLRRLRFAVAEDSGKWIAFGIAAILNGEIEFAAKLLHVILSFVIKPSWCHDD